MAAPIIFNWAGQNRISLKVKAKTPDQKTLVNRIIKKHGDTIRFRRIGSPAKPASRFTTDDPDMIAYIRANKAGRPITEDLSLIPIGCPYCTWKADGNSQAHQEELALHLAECEGMRAVDTTGDS